LGSSLLPNYAARALLGKKLHVFEVAAREAFHLWKSFTQIAGQTINDFGPPTLTGLPF
jgi:hypothetical protein